MLSHEERLEKLFYFAKEELGYAQLTELHLSWFDILLKERHVLLLAPPGHMKTSACTMAYPLFRLTEDPNMKILLVNEVLDNAKGFLREIKAHLTKNERFRERYGHWDLTADTWTEERIQIPRTEIRKEPSIAIASVLGTVVSMHPNLIVVDDPCSNRNTQTPHQRQKVINWFQKDLLPRLDDDTGQIVVIMPRWHTDDLAGFIMSDPGFAHWKVINLKAEWTDEAENHHVLLPEKFNKEKLARIKAQIGTATYNCLYLNDPSGQEGSDFKLSWIESGRYERLPEDLTVFAGVDLAIGRRETNSRFAYCVVGINRPGDAFIIDAYRGRIPFNDQLKVVKRIHRLHQPRLIAIEANAYQSAFIESLRTDPETRLLPIKEVFTQGDPQARIRGLAPLFENGAIRFPKSDGLTWVQNMEEELLHFPHGSDDVLDALWLALQAVQIQRVEPKIVYAEDLA